MVIDSSKEYQSKCLRTESLDLPAIEARMCEHEIRDNLVGYLRELTSVCHEIDKIKKYIFYGKKNNKDGSPVVFLGSSEGIGAWPLDKIRDYEYELINDKFKRQIHAVLGVITEGAELGQLVLDQLDGNGVIAQDEWRNEWGDVGWYHALGNDAADTDLGVCNGLNILKLMRRYPDKFDATAASTHDGH